MNVLDETGVSALLDTLTNALKAEISDNDVVASITQKWSSRELVGQSRQQAIDDLFSDVQASVDDQPTVSKLQATFADAANDTESTDTPAPDAPSTDSDTPPADSGTDTPSTDTAPPAAPNLWIKVFHSGAYIADFDVAWDVPGQPSGKWSQQSKMPGFQETVPLPGDATNVRLHMQNDTGIAWQPKKEIFNRPLEAKELNKCFRVTSTTLGSGWDNKC